MILDNSTTEKILSLFPNMPYNTATYCGCWSKDNVSFQVGTTDSNNNLIAGIDLTVSQNFEIISVKRISTTWGRYTRKQPTITEKLPLHPMGTIPTIYRN